MKLLNILLPICGWTLAIEAQINQNPLSKDDRIYFVESEQQTIKHVTEAEINEGQETLQTNLQNNNRFKDVGNRKKPQDNYAEGTNTNLNVNLYPGSGGIPPPLTQGGPPHLIQGGPPPLIHGVPPPLYAPNQEQIFNFLNQNFNNPNTPNIGSSNQNTPEPAGPTGLFKPTVNIPSPNNPSRQNPSFNNQFPNNPNANVPHFNDVANQADGDTEASSMHGSPPLQFSNMSHAITNFGLNVLKNTDPHVKNIVISPYSITTMLALLQQGSLGVAQRQISEALGLTPEGSRRVYKIITDEVQKRNSRNILKVANNVYVSDTFDLSPAFKTAAIRDFGSEVTPIKFERPASAVRQINNWVAGKTNNKITDLLGPEAVNQNTQMVLLNAVYFKGLWQARFKPEATVPRDFRLPNGVTKPVKFMRMRRVYRSGFDPANNAQAIILPFEKEQYSLMLILPSEKSNLNALVNSISGPQLADYQKFSPKEVDLEIPKFNVRADTELNQVLQRMGITHIFGDRPDLSGVGTHRSLSPQVSSAIHTGMLSVDEDGGTAAAATAFAVVALSYDEPSVVFKANRPFLAVLWDNELVIPLFMAKVEDPIL